MKEISDDYNGFKPVINENSVICMFCYKLGHISDNCPEKKGKTDVVYCVRCGKAGHLAKDCKMTVEKECFYCGESTHTYSQCPEREKVLFEADGHKKESFVICRNCGAVGHLMSECKQPSQRRQLCYRCGEVGHSSSKCSKPAEESASFIVCHHCGEIGHYTRDCKVPSVQHPDVCPLCGEIGHSADECTSDMPSKPKAVEKKVEPVVEKKPEPVVEKKKTEPVVEKKIEKKPEPVAKAEFEKPEPIDRSRKQRKVQRGPDEEPKKETVVLRHVEPKAEPVEQQSKHKRSGSIVEDCKKVFEPDGTPVAVPLFLQNSMRRNSNSAKLLAKYK